MPIINMQLRVETAIFNATPKARYFKKKSLRVAALVFYLLSLGFRFVFILLILFVCGGMDLIRVLKITAHNFGKVRRLMILI